MQASQSFIVDAFTHEHLLGNAAAVVVLSERKDARWMQSVAAEFQLSETAFLYQAGSATDRWELRWFTPSTEVELCGHATLASAHVLWRHLGVDCETLFFSTQSGVLQARREARERIALSFPSRQLAELDPSSISDGRLRLQPIGAAESGDVLLLVLPDVQQLRDYRPDFAEIAALDWRGLIITARAENGGVDFVSRFFAPKMGIPEDPVTGSVHCTLAPYWARQLGKQALVAEQWSERGGRLFLRLENDRVHLAGQARTFLQGELVF